MPNHTDVLTELRDFVTSGASLHDQRIRAMVLRATTEIERLERHTSRGATSLPGHSTFQRSAPVCRECPIRAALFMAHRPMWEKNMPIKATPPKPVGTAAFREVFEKVSHSDDWGVPCVYDYGAWKVWQAAIRYERKRRASTRPSANKGE